MTAPCDLIVTAGRLLTPRALTTGTAVPGFVAVRDGVIVGVGEETDAAAWAAQRTIELPGATLTSGLVDAHIHPVIGVRMARGLDLSGARSREEARRAIADYAAEHSPDGWLLGWGLGPGVLEAGPLDSTLFDGVADGRLVFLTLFDGHSALVSKAALATAGVRGDETFPDSSSVGLDDGGRPNGMLYELSAQSLVLGILPEMTFDEVVDSVEALLKGMAATGIVAGQMLDLEDERSLDVFAAIEERGDLAIRVRVSPWLMPGYQDADLDRLVALQGRHGRRWAVRGVKLMIDGTIDNGTAWLFEPDTLGESTQPLWPDLAEYRRALRHFHDRGIPTTTHAIGDQGISFVAREIAALGDNGTPHRIEHIETLPDPVLDEIVASGAAASMQPTHCSHYLKADQSDNWSRRLGSVRADFAFRIGDLRARGVTVALGSDWPVAPYDPRGIIASAIVRRPAGLPGVPPVRLEQAISAAAAIEGYTSEYWASVGESGGRLVVGDRADLTAFGLDPLTTDPDAFAAAPVLLTVVDGEVVIDAAVPVGA